MDFHWLNSHEDSLNKVTDLETLSFFICIILWNYPKQDLDSEESYLNFVDSIPDNQLWINKQDLIQKINQIFQLEADKNIKKQQCHSNLCFSQALR